MKIFITALIGILFVILFQNSQSTNDLSKITIDFSLQYLKDTGNPHPDHHGNLIVSPLGVASCLGLAYAGSSGLTKRQIRLYMFEDIDDAQIYNDIRTTVSQLKTEGHLKFYLFNTLNTLILPNSVKNIHDAYQQRIKYQFNADLMKSDFDDRRLLAAEIDRYVNRKSWGHIKALLTSADIVVPDFDSLIFLNVLHFHGNWLHAFDEQETENLPFQNDRGQIQYVKMMSQIGGHFFYANFNDIQSLGIPYAGNRLILYIFLPPKNQSIKTMEKSLNFGTIKKLIGESVKKRLKVTIPKLELNQTVDMKQTLKHMGMDRMFSDHADFSLITGQRMQASSIFHGAFLNVDEKGHPMVKYDSKNGQKNENDQSYDIFAVNRPFLFAVVDKTTEMFMIFGRVTHIPA